jgi:hypothetical protein
VLLAVVVEAWVITQTPLPMVKQGRQTEAVVVVVA